MEKHNKCLFTSYIWLLIEYTLHSLATPDKDCWKCFRATVWYFNCYSNCITLRSLVTDEAISDPLSVLTGSYSNRVKTPPIPGYTSPWACLASGLLPGTTRLQVGGHSSFRSGFHWFIQRQSCMLSAPYGCTHPPPPVLPFVLAQNLSPKDICQKWHHKLKVVWCIYVSIAYNRLNLKSQYLTLSGVCTSVLQVASDIFTMGNIKLQVFSVLWNWAHGY